MTIDVRIRDLPLETSTRYEGGRTTPPPARRRFREALGEAGAGLLSGVESAASFVPGGALVSAALRAGSSPGAGATAGNSVPSGAASLASSTESSLELLELQRRIGLEQRQWSALSNVLKARHDTAKAVIQNVR